MPTIYSPLEKLDDEDEDGVGEQLLGGWPALHKRSRRFQYQELWLRYCVYFTHGALLALSILFFSLWKHTQGQLLNPVYSPANEAVEYYKELMVWNGTLNYPSIYRGYPTPQIDAAWRSISQDGMCLKFTRLTLKQVLQLGKEDTPSKVKLRDEDGGGYLASLEFPHQLHCLDMLRKYTYREYYEKSDPGFHVNSEFFRMHLDHCIEILRQHLMCSADVGMITFEWVKGYNLPYPDFNTRHKCRNFEKLLSWASDNAVHVRKDHVLRFGDEVDLPQAP